jgi:hypothetical protein
MKEIHFRNMEWPFDLSDQKHLQNIIYPLGYENKVFAPYQNHPTSHQACIETIMNIGKSKISCKELHLAFTQYWEIPDTVFSHN